MKLLYVGRLDKEKGIESIIFCIKDLIRKDQLFHINIYGTGYYTQEILNIANQYPAFVTYHGRKHKKEIITQWKQSDFFVMPSTFLETFGLTACESLLCGVPVIGNKKGGLVTFIDNELDIQQAQGSHDGEKLVSIILQLITHNRNKQHYHTIIQSAQQNYTIEQWKTRIQTHIKKHNIGIISDFINYNGGGIETHINDIHHILHRKYNMTLYGHHAPKGKRASIKKIGFMLGSFCNIRDNIAIQNMIKKKKIGLIRWHSVSRVIGWLPLRGNGSIQQIITHHELGLFHPFPSKVTSNEQLPTARSLSSFIQAGQTTSFFKKIAIIGKYSMIRMIHKQLQKKVKTHIVPSERMVIVVRNRHPQANIICIPHFVDIE